jgi:hypothetical protein
VASTVERELWKMRHEFYYLKINLEEWGPGRVSLSYDAS